MRRGGVAHIRYMSCDPAFFRAHYSLLSFVTVASFNNEFGFGMNIYTIYLVVLTINYS